MSTSTKNWKTFLTKNMTIGITIVSLDHGLLLSDPLLAIISESQLFGEQVRSRRLEKDRRQDLVSLIRNLTELHPGVTLSCIFNMALAVIGVYKPLKRRIMRTNM